MGFKRIPPAGYRYPEVGEMEAGDVVYAQPQHEGEEPGSPYILLAKLNSKQSRVLRGSWDKDWETWACVYLEPSNPFGRMNTLHISPQTYWLVRDEH